MFQTVSRWARFSLRELLLIMLVVGLGLALFIVTRKAPFRPSDFHAELESRPGDLLRAVIAGEAQGASVHVEQGRSGIVSTGESFSEVVTSNWGFSIRGLKDKTDIARLLTQFELTCKAELRKHACRMMAASGYKQFGADVGLRYVMYTYDGGSGVAYCLATPGNSKLDELNVRLTVVELCNQSR